MLSQPGDSVASTYAEETQAEPHPQEDDPDDLGARTGKVPVCFGCVMGVMVMDWRSGFPKVGDQSRERELHSQEESQGYL